MHPQGGSESEFDGDVEMESRFSVCGQHWREGIGKCADKSGGGGYGAGHRDHSGQLHQSCG